MITIQITQSGQTRRETVEQAEFVVKCHYSRCKKEFTTIEPFKIYCEPQHRKYASELKTAMSLPREFYKV